MNNDNNKINLLLEKEDNHQTYKQYKKYKKYKTITLSENIILNITKPLPRFYHKYNPNFFFDKIFIINLDKSPERWNKVTKNLLDFSITNFERQPGIYLPRTEPHSSLPANFYANLEAYGGKFKFDPDYILNCVGTNLAHFSIVEKAIARNYQRILVLEDDVFLNKQFLARFTRATRDMEMQNLDWNLLYLGYKRSRSTFTGERITPDLMRPKQFIRGAYGYALHRSAFPIITKMQLYGGMEIDAFFEFVICRYGKVLCFNTPIIEHRDNMVSTITKAKWKTRNF